MTEQARPPLERQLVELLQALEPSPSPGGQESRLDLSYLYDVQLASRHCDLAARWLRSNGRGYYTIGSAGHESNAVLAMATRPTDPALLHYRSGGFYLARAGLDGVSDILAGVVAATSEPISGGRHKVFGRHDLAIIPQTSTIASHLPRAVGVAFAIDRAAKLRVKSSWERDAITICTFGDATANHSVATGAFNTTMYCAYQGLPLPLLFVCEDNGLGISVRTPAGWIETSFSSRPHLRYEVVDGDDPLAVAEAASSLADWVRKRRKPAFLHLRTVRYGGHAGTDVEAAYRSAAEMRADALRDPILGTARALLGCGWTTESLLQRHEEVAELVQLAAASLAEAEQLQSADEVMRPLAIRQPEEVARLAVQWSPSPAGAEPVTFAQAVNTTLATLLDQQPNVLVFGEDVAVKGGVYGVTKGLMAKAGAGRVFDTLLDETSILGLANGSAISGFVPIPEIEYLAYLHNAEDQLRGEAATLSFFSNGQYRNGMVVRVAGYGYQEGFGGHFHNDDAIAVLRDIPGIVVASPSRPDDAAAMLTTCVAAAQIDGTVSVFLEPIARYHTQDLYEAGDREWMAALQPDHVPIGSARTYGDGLDLTIVTCGNGVLMSLRVAKRLMTRGIGVRVVDLRWLSPLPVEDLIRETRATRAVLVADETRASGGWSEGVITALVECGITTRIGRATSKDSFIPLGDAAKLVLLSEAEIEAAAYGLLHG
ncbi:MAG TPA: thiamine pyrophosphate-dependent enzyme [Ilumatobacteraceae bacterium]|nr:thiamine pyrophosphate-dependent enzyme [Ilumatobacteraceae bacterium]